MELAPEGTCAIAIRAQQNGDSGMWASLARGLAAAKSPVAAEWDMGDEEAHATVCKDLFRGTLREMMRTALTQHKLQQRIEGQIRKSLEPDSDHPPHEKLRGPLQEYLSDASQKSFVVRSFALAHVLADDETNMQGEWAPKWLAPWAAKHTETQIDVYCAPAGLGADSSTALVHFEASHNSQPTNTAAPIRLVHTKGPQVEWALLVADTADSLPPPGDITPFNVLVDPRNATRCKACAKRVPRDG